MKEGHHGSSKAEETSEAQDGRREEDDGEEDGNRPSQDRQEEIVIARGAGPKVPAPSLFPFQNNQLLAAVGDADSARLCLPGNGWEVLFGDQHPERIKSRGKFLLIDTAQDHISAEALLLEKWIAPDLHVGVCRLQL